LLQTLSPRKALIANHFQVSEDDLPDLIVQHEAAQNYLIGDASFFIDLEQVYDHKFSCPKKGKMKLHLSTPNGLATKFIFRCAKCEVQIDIGSHSKAEKEKLNKGAVWGCTAAGIGHHQLEELLAHLGVACMSHTLYSKQENEIFKVIATFLIIYTTKWTKMKDT
jgi:hypothetical protein